MWHNCVEYVEGHKQKGTAEMIHPPPQKNIFHCPAVQINIQTLSP